MSHVKTSPGARGAAPKGPGKALDRVFDTHSYQFVPPDPNAPIVVAHKTPSSRYWEQRFVTLLKRSGFIWPWPPRKGKR